LASTLRFEDLLQAGLCIQAFRRIFWVAVTRRRASDVGAVLAFVAAAYAIVGPEPLPTELRGRLRRIVPCDGV
jgi:hypothetical protein